MLVTLTSVGVVVAVTVAVVLCLWLWLWLCGCIAVSLCVWFSLQQENMNIAMQRDTQSAVELSDMLRRRTSAIRRYQTQMEPDLPTHERLHRTPLQSQVLASEVQPTLYISLAEKRRAVRRTLRHRRQRRQEQAVVRAGSVVVAKHMAYISRHTAKSNAKYGRRLAQLETDEYVGHLRAHNFQQQARLRAKRKLEREKKRQALAKRREDTADRLSQAQAQKLEERDRRSAARSVLVRKSPLSPSPFRFKRNRVGPYAKFPPPAQFRVDHSARRPGTSATATVELSGPDYDPTLAPLMRPPPTPGYDGGWAAVPRPDTSGLGASRDFEAFLSDVVKREAAAQSELDQQWSQHGHHGSTTMDGSSSLHSGLGSGSVRLQRSSSTVPPSPLDDIDATGLQRGGAGSASFPVLPMRRSDSRHSHRPSTPQQPSPTVHPIQHAAAPGITAAGRGTNPPIAGMPLAAMDSVHGLDSVASLRSMRSLGSFGGGSGGGGGGSPIAGPRYTGMRGDSFHAPSPPGTPTISTAAKVRAAQEAAKEAEQSMPAVMGVKRMEAVAMTAEELYQPPLSKLTKEEARAERKRLRKLGLDSATTFNTGYGISKRASKVGGMRGTLRAAVMCGVLIVLCLCVRGCVSTGHPQRQHEAAGERRAGWWWWYGVPARRLQRRLRLPQRWSDGRLPTPATGQARVAA